MPGPESGTATLGLALTRYVTLGELLAFSDPELSDLGLGASRLTSLGVYLTFGASPPAGLGDRAAAGRWWAVPEDTAAQG